MQKLLLDSFAMRYEMNHELKTSKSGRNIITLKIDKKCFTKQIPQPPDKWEGIRDASEYKAHCIQFDMMTDLTLGSEDCLYLNIFTPKVLINNLSQVSIYLLIHYL